MKLMLLENMCLDFALEKMFFSTFILFVSIQLVNLLNIQYSVLCLFIY